MITIYWCLFSPPLGVLNPLDCPHHMRAETQSPYREGVVLKKQLGVGKGSYVDVGKIKVGINPMRAT